MKGLQDMISQRDRRLRGLNQQLARLASVSSARFAPSGSRFTPMSVACRVRPLASAAARASASIASLTPASPMEKPLRLSRPT